MNMFSIKTIFSDVVNKIIDFLAKYFVIAWEYISNDVDIAVLFFAVGVIILYVIFRSTRWG